MREIALYVPGWFNNEIFDVNHSANCDNWLMPYIKLKERLFLIGYNLTTVDLATNAETLLAFGEDYVKKFEKQYFFVYENQYIKKVNLSKKGKNYKKIFTWNDDDIDNVQIIKYYYPQYYVERDFGGYENRSLLLSMIANNKSISSDTSSNMYLERQKIIQYFENYPVEFELYGSGWDMPFLKNSFLYLVNNRFKFFSRAKKLKAYKGFAISKHLVYSKSKFSICFENVKNINGYITEKIFDSFFSGCVPVYAGAKNINQYIPSNCYIDYESFNNLDSLRHFLLNMTESQFLEYQKNITEFLKSDQFHKFSTENFCQIIIDNLLND